MALAKNRVTLQKLSQKIENSLAGKLFIQSPFLGQAQIGQFLKGIVFLNLLCRISQKSICVLNADSQISHRNL